jgi:hypothetical protein
VERGSQEVEVMSEVTLEMSAELARRREEEARRQGLPPADLAVRLLEGSLRPEPGSRTQTDAAARQDGETAQPPIWQVAAGLLDEAPAEELERLPPDLSENLDYYLYGAPKRDPRSPDARPPLRAGGFRGAAIGWPHDGLSCKDRSH